MTTNTGNYAAHDSARDYARTVLDGITGLYLTATAGLDDSTIEAIEETAREMALWVAVRSGWTTAAEPFILNPAEFRIDLSTGGPACRIVGDLDMYGTPAPESTRIEGQGWGTPWLPIDTDGEHRSALDWFTGLFYYGE